MPEVHDEDRLAAVMRAGLAARAESAPDRLAEPLPTRRRGRRGPLLVAAAAVVVAAGTGAVVLGTDGGDDQAPPADTTTPTGSPAPGPVPSDWRLESYAGAEVRVPPTWGWGGVPQHGYDCGSLQASVGPDGARSSSPTAPYVGRPVVMSDMCTTFDPGSSHPAGDAVWLGSPLDPGIQRYSDGIVSETIGVAGTRVTVFTSDASLRRQVLGTVAAITGSTDDNGCPVDPPASGWPAAAPEGLRPTSLSLCLYDSYLGGSTTLLWSGERDAAAASAYVDAFDRASAVYDPNRLAAVPREGQWMALGVQGRVDGGVATRWDTVSFEASQILAVVPGAGRVAGPLDRTTVEPWARGEEPLRAYAVGPPDAGTSGTSQFFRGVLG